MVHAALDAHVLELAAQHAVEPQHHSRAVLGEYGLIGGLAQALARREAQHRLVGLVDPDGAAVDADQRHADGGALHDLAQQRSALVEAEDIRLGVFGVHPHPVTLASEP